MKKTRALCHLLSSGQEWDKDSSLPGSVLSPMMLTLGSGCSWYQRLPELAVSLDYRASDCLDMWARLMSTVYVLSGDNLSAWTHMITTHPYPSIGNLVGKPTALWYNPPLTDMPANFKFEILVILTMCTNVYRTGSMGRALF